MYLVHWPAELIIVLESYILFFPLLKSIPYTYTKYSLYSLKQLESAIIAALPPQYWRFDNPDSSQP